MAVTYTPGANWVCAWSQKVAAYLHARICMCIFEFVRASTCVYMYMSTCTCTIFIVCMLKCVICAGVCVCTCTHVPHLLRKRYTQTVMYIHAFSASPYLCLTDSFRFTVFFAESLFLTPSFFCSLSLSLSLSFLTLTHSFSFSVSPAHAHVHITHNNDTCAHST